MKKFALLFIAQLLLLPGCWILPSGGPPEGNITDNQIRAAKQVKNPAQAMDYLVSSLTVALLSNCPGEKIRLDSDAASLHFSTKVLHESSRISGNSVALTDSGWVLKSVRDKETLQMKLLYKGKTIWSETLEYSFDPAVLN